ncbi:MAG TPA: RidA family protein, partial [Haliscomenobacter sp.]|nr:RidA family protein [Haliscomenobacter sp.]
MSKCTLLSTGLVLGLLTFPFWGQAQTKPSKIDQKLKELGLVLPATSAPIANYVNAVQTGKLIFLAGKGPKRE